MKYAPEEVLQYISEENVKFIRLAFCDVYGRQHNIAIMASELERAFAYGIAIDASAIGGFGGEVHSDLLLHPDASTLIQLPWRPEQGSVARMFCDITYPDGRPFEADGRYILRQAVEEAAEMGVRFAIGSEMEFYLFRLDENGLPTRIPYDHAGYMDIAPEDRGENVRREICLTLEQMGIQPESSHHESGPGQNEIDFRYSDPLTAADNAVTFHAVVKTVAARNGLWADFSPKPIPDRDGNGMHINVSVKGEQGADLLPPMIAGIMEKIRDMTVFLNPCEGSYDRLGVDKAPAYITWSRENRSQLIRIPAAVGEYRRAELRSPDPMANPYLAFALVIRAALYGIRHGLTPPEAADFNIFLANADVLARYEKLPTSLREAGALARGSGFIRELIPEQIIAAYCGQK
ncbi:MAG: glutamine synthetase family protein [Oscillospiraceae bacterium]|nr:glutamine synthetase family protein [Oscillospiraceae bacterium]